MILGHFSKAICLKIMDSESTTQVVRLKRIYNNGNKKLSRKFFEMGKRKSKRKVVAKKKERLPSAFTCPFCNHADVVEVRM